jgi:hypothetical protein
MQWPFPDERAFWLWAFNPDAELDDHDEDLLLWHPDGLHLLLTAAADPGCPKHDYCANVLASYTCAIIRWTAPSYIHTCEPQPNSPPPSRTRECTNGPRTRPGCSPTSSPPAP